MNADCQLYNADLHELEELHKAAAGEELAESVGILCVTLLTM